MLDPDRNDKFWILNSSRAQGIRGWSRICKGWSRMWNSGWNQIWSLKSESKMLQKKKYDLVLSQIDNDASKSINVCPCIIIVNIFRMPVTVTLCSHGLNNCLFMTVSTFIVHLRASQILQAGKFKSRRSRLAYSPKVATKANISRKLLNGPQPLQ